jgi:DNA-binding beta-propeller fold protein YncE
MTRQQLKVSQDWVRHFDAPVALLRTSAASGHALAVDEDGIMHLLDPSGTELLSKELPWMPSAAALDEDARNLAVLSPGGFLFVFDRGGHTLNQIRIGLRPLYLDLSPTGDLAAFVDGNGVVGTVELATGKIDRRDEKGPFCYVKFVTSGSEILAAGQYGQVMFVSAVGDVWQKDFRCHTRTPAASRSAEIILLPSPHYGIIALKGDGTQIGLIDVPEGPRGVAVTGDGQKVFAVNEKNELIIFEADGKVFFRQSLGSSVAYFECDDAGSHIVAMMTSGSIERFSVSRTEGGEERYIEFGGEASADSSEGPAVLWQAKVFSALGGTRGGQVAVTRSARHVALLDVNARLRVFDRSGTQVSEESRIEGRQPQLKASRTQDLVIAASSDVLLALDMRSFRQRRLALRNEWTTHFDISPAGIFFVVADFFRGISLFDETLSRFEYVETDDDVLDLAVDGQRHSAVALGAGSLSFFDEKGAPIARVPYSASSVTAICGLGQGFAVASRGKVDAFTTSGAHTWSADVPGEAAAISPTRTGLVVSTAEGTAYVVDARGAVAARLMRRPTARFFGSRDESGAVISVEYRGQLITARSSESGVLWRREMDDDITAMEISPDGGFVMVLSGVYLYALSTASGEETPQEKLYLEI